MSSMMGDISIVHPSVPVAQPSQPYAHLHEGAGKTLKPQNLMNELAQSGVKYNADDVISITKTPDGKLLWLEKGNDASGFKHIMNSHAVHFHGRGVNDISGFLNKTLLEPPINTGIGKVGPYAEYLIDGSRYRVVYGTNGYIVSFFPID